MATGLEKVSFHSNYQLLIVLISHTSKGVLKILQVRFQQYVNQELPDLQAGFRKGKVTRYQLPTFIHWITEKTGEFQKKHLLLFY